jgi:hypothetical protein
MISRTLEITRHLVGVAVFAAMLPVLLPAYGISRILGIDPFSMDGLGIEFMVFGGISVAVFTLYLGLLIGYLL